jgi:hypothetical protein
MSVGLKGSVIDTFLNLNFLRAALQHSYEDAQNDLGDMSTDEQRRMKSFVVLRYWASYWGRVPIVLAGDVKTRHQISP